MKYQINKIVDYKMMKEPKHYISPVVMETPILPEGVFCMSGNVVDYKQEEFEW